jgi:Tfp pilus assembly protein PilX
MSDTRFPARSARCSAAKGRLPTSCSPRHQHGVVLVIALVVLVLMSLLAVTSVRNAGSSESVAGNVRTTELATQAADMALRYCEDKAVQMAVASVTPLSTPDQWKNSATWDTPATNPPWNNTSPATSAFVLPSALVNQPGATLTYKRFPECMVEQHAPAAPVAGGSMFYVITARGFGPEVAAVNAARSRPVGSEVWLQSHIEIH